MAKGPAGFLRRLPRHGHFECHAGLVQRRRAVPRSGLRGRARPEDGCRRGGGHRRGRRIDPTGVEACPAGRADPPHRPCDWGTGRTDRYSHQHRHDECRGGAGRVARGRVDPQRHHGLLGRTDGGTRRAAAGPCHPHAYAGCSCHDAGGAPLRRRGGGGPCVPRGSMREGSQARRAERADHYRSRHRLRQDPGAEPIAAAELGSARGNGLSRAGGTESQGLRRQAHRSGQARRAGLRDRRSGRPLRPGGGLHCPSPRRARDARRREGHWRIDEG